MPLAESGTKAVAIQRQLAGQDRKRLALPEKIKKQ